MSFNFLELKEFLLDLLKANIGIFFFPVPVSCGSSWATAVTLSQSNDNDRFVTH